MDFPGRTEQWWLNLDSCVSPLEVWKKSFRVTRKDFLELKMIRPYTRERSKRARQDIITLEKRVAMTLHYLKDQGSIVITANVFGCSISSTCIWLLHLIYMYLAAPSHLHVTL